MNMTIQIIRDTEGVITTGNFCQFGVRKKTNTGGGNGGGGEIPDSDSDFTKVTYIKTDTSDLMWVDAEYDSENVNGELHIDWGDGDKEVLNVADFEADEYYLYAEHEYSVNGEYVIKVYSTTKASYVGFGEITKVTDWGSPPSSSIYFNSNNLIEVPSTLHPSLTNLAGMFGACDNFNQDIGMWDTSNVTNMLGMFQGAISFNQDISMWDVSKVTDMDSMFQGAIAFNQPLDNWNTSNVTTMTWMFRDAISFNQDLSQWCVSNITSLPYEFEIGATNWTLPRPVWGTCPIG